MSALTELQGVLLQGRQANLVIGFPNDPSLDVSVPFNARNATGVDVSGQDIQFIVNKSLKPSEPNTCDIRVYNLSKEMRKSVSGVQKLTVRLEAGYKDGVSQLYFAEARAAWTTGEGPDYITHIESTDTIARPTGIRTTRKIQPGSTTGNIYRTMGAKVPLDQALRALAAAMGIGAGNLQQALAKGLPISSVNGSAIVGNAARRMTDICRSAGLEWSVQDGVLQLLNIGQALSTTKAILVSEATGMVGSPSVDSQGAVSVTTLLIPGLVPGVLVKIDSLFVQGGYRIEKIRYEGDTRGTAWYAHFDAVRY